MRTAAAASTPPPAATTSGIHPQQAVRMYGPWAIIFIVVVVALFSARSWWGHRAITPASAPAAANSMPLASEQLDKWPLIGVEPHRRSIVLRVFGTQRPILSGQGGILVCVYGTREEHLMGNECPPNGLTQVFLENPGDAIVYRRYAYTQ